MITTIIFGLSVGGLILIERIRKEKIAETKQKLEKSFVIKPWSEFHQYDQLLEAMEDGSIAAMTLLVPYPYTMEHARSFVDFAKGKPTEFFFIEVDGNYAGGIGIHAISAPGRQHTKSLGYYLAPKYRGFGLMTKVVTAILEKVREHFPECQVVEADTFEHNEASARVLQKNGFVSIGVLPLYYIKNGKPVNARHFMKELV
jgi:RimJ/RimL family protein N-acetyltransferase